jgi:plastocyanin
VRAVTSARLHRRECRLHTPAENGQSSAYAERSATKRYRTTPLRGLWHLPELRGPYFHDGSTGTLQEAVEYYIQLFGLSLTAPATGSPPRVRKSRSATKVEGQATRSLTAVLSTAFMATVLNSCSSSTTSPSVAPTDVTIQDFVFSPGTVTIKAGTMVRWTNNGPSVHTTTSDNGVWESGTLAPPGGGGGGGYSRGSLSSVSLSSASLAGGSFQFTFMQPGTYPYHCAIHPPAMFPGFTGAVVVNP